MEIDCVSEVRRVAVQPTITGMTIGEIAPTFSDYQGKKCYGIRIEIINKNDVNMFETGLQL